MKTKFTKKQWWLVAALLAAVVFFIYQLVTTPRNIGPKLEYVGSKNVGCEWWQIPLYMGWCQGPSYQYYFATDMTQTEVEKYFKQAQFIDADSTVSGDSNYRYLTYSVAGAHFQIGYFDRESTRSFLASESSFKTDKPNLVVIGDDAYQDARNAY